MNQTSQSAFTGPGSQPDLAPAQPRGHAELFLEGLQKRVYGAIGLTAEDCQQREWIGQQTILPIRLQQKADQLSASEFAQYRSAILEALTRDELLPRPTAFERPHQYSILHDLKESIEDAASLLSVALPFHPVFGTLPTRLLEPLMVRVPSTAEIVVVIDGSLLTYVHLLAKSVAQALPFELIDPESLLHTPPGPGWEENIDPDGAATERFAELMLAAISGHAASAPAYAPEPGCEQTIAALCECMELFVIGREYARLCEGAYLEAGSERRQAHGQSFEALVWTADQEFRADALGLALMLQAAVEKGESARLAFWSADILLASFDILDRALTSLENPAPQPLIALPPTIFTERRALLRSLMNQLDGGSRAVGFADALEPVITLLSERFDVIVQDVRFGPRPKH